MSIDAIRPPKKVPVSMSIARVTSNEARQFFMRISASDALSGLRIVDIDIEMETFAYLLSGSQRGGDPDECEATVFDNFDTLGKQKELKEIQVPLGEDKDYLANCAKYEVDGWRVWETDAHKNYHRKFCINGEWSVKQSFARYVEQDS